MDINSNPTFETVTRMENAIARLLNLIEQGHTLSLGYSGGKDSGICMVLMLEAIRRAKDMGIKQGTHSLTSSNTTIENPAPHYLLLTFMDEIQDYCSEYDLPVETHIVTPTLASQFVVTTLGRGTLVRTPTNSVKDGKKKRPCSDDWKVKPQNRLRKELQEVRVREGYRETITVLGTRFEESTSRSTSMKDRGENSFVPVRHVDGYLTFSPIADWTTDDVWEALALFMHPNSAPFPAPAKPYTFTKLERMYRAGNDGVCGVVIGDSGNKAACGSRFGCAFCCISGEKDKSLESQIKYDEYKHLAGLNRFRNYLMNSQWDMSKRELIGRTLSDAGYIRVAPDVYSYEERIRMLRYLLTLDVLEEERAEQHTADLAAGLIEKSPDNHELCEVQFQMIDPDQLVAIDFMLSMHPYCPHSFPAVTEWYEIKTMGRRYHVPEVAALPKVNVPVYGWYKVGKFDLEVPTDGLRDYKAEMWNKYRHPNRVSTYAHSTQGDRMVYFEEEQQLTVDKVEACMFVTVMFDFEMYMAARHNPGIDSARFWLNETILKLPSGMAATYQEMAVRGQYFNHLAQKLNVTPKELDQHLIKHAISDSEHDKLLGIKSYPLFAILEEPVAA